MNSTCLPRLLLRALIAAAFTVAVAWPPLAFAQPQSQPSLAELARQEAARRKTVKDTKKVITNKDLPDSAIRQAATTTMAQADAGTAQASGDQKPSAAAPARDAAAADDKGEAFWHGRMAQAREALRSNEVILDALQMRVQGLTADYNRSDLFERTNIGNTRKNALDEIEKVKGDVATSKKQIADIEEEARKAGVPPGWLR